MEHLVVANGAALLSVACMIVLQRAANAKLDVRWLWGMVGAATLIIVLQYMILKSFGEGQVDPAVQTATATAAPSMFRNTPTELTERYRRLVSSETRAAFLERHVDSLMDLTLVVDQTTIRHPHVIVSAKDDPLSCIFEYTYRSRRIKEGSTIRVTGYINDINHSNVRLEQCELAANRPSILRRVVGFGGTLLE